MDFLEFSKYLESTFEGFKENILSLYLNYVLFS